VLSIDSKKLHHCFCATNNKTATPHFASPLLAAGANRRTITCIECETKGGLIVCGLVAAQQQRFCKASCSYGSLQVRQLPLKRTTNRLNSRAALRNSRAKSFVIQIQTINASLLSESTRTSETRLLTPEQASVLMSTPRHTHNWFATRPACAQARRTGGHRVPAVQIAEIETHSQICVLH
jgi:hypothetical protein